MCACIFVCGSNQSLFADANHLVKKKVCSVMFKVVDRKIKKYHDIHFCFSKMYSCLDDWVVGSACFVLIIFNF